MSHWSSRTTDRAAFLQLLSLTASLVCTAIACGQTTSWLDPVSGSFGDARRWSNGVPADGDSIGFGVHAGTRPFTVTLDVPHLVNGLFVTTQRPTFDLADLRSAWGGGLIVFNTFSDAPSDDMPYPLTLTNGSFRIFGSVVTGTHGNISLVDAAGVTDALVMNGGALALDDASLQVLSGFGITTHVAIGADATINASGSSTLVFAKGSWGLNGGNANVVISPGSTLTASDLTLGGEFAPTPYAPGSATLVIDGGTIANSTIRVGGTGLGALLLHDGSTITSSQIKVGGDVPSSAIVDGTVSAATTMFVLPAGKSDGTLLVAGRGTNLTVGSLFFQGGAISQDAHGLGVVRDGAVMNVLGNLTLIGGYANNTLSIGPDASAHCEASVSFSGHPTIETVGPNGLLAVTGSIDPSSVSGALTLRVRNGGQVQCHSLSQTDIDSKTAFIFGNDGSGSIDADSTIKLGGTLVIAFEDGFVPLAGATYELMHAPSITGEFWTLDVASAHGYPPLLHRTTDALSVRFTDHLDALDIVAPAELLPGFEYPLQAIATLDGLSDDVARLTAWSVDPPSAAAISDDGRLYATTAGVIHVTAQFGLTTVTHTLVVSPQPIAAPFLLASVAFDGSLGNGDSGGQSGSADAFIPYGRCMSGDGRYVVFTSLAKNLTRPPGAFATRIAVRDLAQGATTIASVGSSGAAAPSGCSWGTVSDQGRFVAFTTGSQLTSVPHAPSNSATYLRDIELGITELISVGLDGLGYSSVPAGVSADGRFVLFGSEKPDFVADDTNAVADLFMRDRLTQTTWRVSVDAAGGEFAVFSFPEDMTPDGWRVVYLQPTAPGSASYRVVVKDLTSGATIDATGELGDMVVSTSGKLNAAISADGGFVVFMASGLGFDPPPPSDVPQVFIRDLSTGAVTPVTRLADGSWANVRASGLSISANGRFVSFMSTATNIAGDPLPPQSRQLYRFDRITGLIELVSVGPLGPLGPWSQSYTGPWTSISRDGRSIAFATREPTLVPFDTEEYFDVIVRRYGSFVTGDINADGATNALDLAAVIGAWGSTDANADLDGDGTVGPRDLAIVLGGWS